MNTPSIAFVDFEYYIKHGPFEVFSEHIGQYTSVLITCMFVFQFVGVEGVITAVVDQWPTFLRRGYRRELFAAFVCVLNFLLGLSMVTNVSYILQNHM